MDQLQAGQVRLQQGGGHVRSLLVADLDAQNGKNAYRRCTESRRSSPAL
jgi:hypothetical protein